MTENPQPRTLQKWWKFCTISKCTQNVLRKYFSAKLFVPLIKRSFSTTFKAVYGKLNFWQKIHSRGPYKNGENFVLSQNVLRKYFLAKFFVPLIKRSVSTNFKAVYGKLNFWQKIHSRGPYKNGENFVLSQNVVRKYFLAKFFVSLIKRSVSTIFKAVFGKLNFWQKINSRGPYKNGENFVLSQNVVRKYFLAKFFVPLIKKSFSTNFKAVYGKLNFWQKIHSRGPYKNGENFVLSQNVLRKYFLAKFFVPLIKRSVSTNFKAGFGKLNFWLKIHSRGPYKNGDNFVLSQNVLRKYFFAKFFVPLIKRSVSTNFKAVFGKLNFWQKIRSRGPYKNGENFVLSQNVLRKYFLATLFVPLIKRSFSTNFQAVFGKLNFWRKIHRRDPYKNGENLILSQNVLRKYFYAKFFVPLIKRSVSTNFKAGFGKFNIWLKIHSRGPYKNGDNFVLSQNVLRKYFLAKFFVPLIKRSVSTNFKAVFGKLNFWQKIHSGGPYKNGENFVLSQNRLRKYFLATLFVPLINRSFSTNFQAVFGKLNFWRKIHSCGPYKNGENFVLSQNVLRKYFLTKFFVPLIKRSVSTNFKGGFGKLNFWQKIHSRGPYKNGDNFVLSQNELRKYFWQNSLFHSSKEVLLQTLRLFLENWIFERK